MLTQAERNAILYLTWGERMDDKAKLLKAKKLFMLSSEFIENMNDLSFYAEPKYFFAEPKKSNKDFPLLIYRTLKNHSFEIKTPKKEQIKNMLQETFKAIMLLSDQTKNTFEIETDLYYYIFKYVEKYPSFPKYDLFETYIPRPTTPFSTIKKYLKQKIVNSSEKVENYFEVSILSSVSFKEKENKSNNILFTFHLSYRFTSIL